MSPSIVTALKVSITPADSSACSAGAAIGASVKTKDSIVAMSGAIMPAPLAMPLIVTVAPPSFAVAVATFGKVSVVMIALAASRKRPGAASRDELVEHAVELAASSGSPITPVEARKTSAGLQPAACARELRGERRRRASGLAGEGIGVAGIDHERARLAALELRAAPLDRRRRAFRAREDARDRRALVEQREQHVGAVLVADAGRGGGEAHAGDRRHVGNVLRRERGDGG